MRPIVPLILLGMTLSVSAAPAPLPKRPPRHQPDHVALQGEWKAIRYDGEDPALYWRSVNLVVRSNRATFRTEQNSGHVDDRVWVFTIDARSSPKGMTLRDEENPSTYFHLCIYRLEGDRLTLSVPHRSDTPRPTEFAIKRSVKLYVFSRVGR